MAGCTIPPSTIILSMIINATILGSLFILPRDLLLCEQLSHNVTRNKVCKTLFYDDKFLPLMVFLVRNGQLVTIISLLFTPPPPLPLN